MTQVWNGDRCKMCGSVRTTGKRSIAVPTTGGYRRWKLCAVCAQKVVAIMRADGIPIRRSV